MNKDVPSNFSYVPGVGPADPFRSTLPFEGRQVTVYVGLDRIGKVLPLEKEVFKTVDPANEPLGPYPSMESAALGLRRAFLFAAEEAAQINAGHAPTPTFVRKLTVYVGGAPIGTVNVWSDGSATAFDDAGKFLGIFPSAERAKKACQGERNERPGFSSNSVN
jgi:hypothetical protein